MYIRRVPTNWYNRNYGDASIVRWLMKREKPQRSHFYNRGSNSVSLDVLRTSTFRKGLYFLQDIKSFPSLRAVDLLLEGCPRPPPMMFTFNTFPMDELCGSSAFWLLHVWAMSQGNRVSGYDHETRSLLSKNLASGVWWIVGIDVVHLVFGIKLFTFFNNPLLIVCHPPIRIWT